MVPEWLALARRLQAIARIGLTYARDPFDVERYTEVQSIAERILALGGIPTADLSDFALDPGYATPKIDVRAVVARESTILLVKERSDGLWTLPGGWADIGTSLREAVEKEVQEESGYTVRSRRLLAVYDRDRHGHPAHPNHIWKVFVECELIGGAATESIETSGVAFHAVHSLPPLSPGRVTPAQIRRMLELLGHPELPPDFD